MTVSSHTLAQQSWIRALDSKFKIRSKKPTNFRIYCKTLTAGGLDFSMRFIPFGSESGGEYNLK
jgi:hypothetical protein